MLKPVRFRFWGLVTLLLLGAQEVLAQVSVKDSAISMVMIRPSYALQVPGGDLANRFGINQSIGIATTYKHRSGWMFTAEGSFIFGNKITEPNLFSMLTTSEGTIIGEDGLYADVRAFQRGYYVTLGAGRIFPIKKPNPNCGFIVEGSLGFIQHKIKIQDKKNSVPALREEYLKGYDHLSNGLVARQFFGFLYVGNFRLVNFYGGIEFVQGFTKNRRSFNYADMAPDNTLRTDLLIGLRVGWVIPLFKEAPNEFYIY